MCIEASLGLAKHGQASAPATPATSAPSVSPGALEIVIDRPGIVAVKLSNL